ncbi:MAG: LysR family transcriptional regulator [Deltaproteobacteria bacterium]|nr:LysR family transcriptional regulator [Deltaproteobacteria bacterium]
MNLTDLDTFERVATHGTLAAAARELGVPKSTVSRRLTRLEEALGLDLLHRGGRRITLTQAGAELHGRSAAPLLVLRDLDSGLAADSPRGTLRITAPHDLGTTAWFAGMLTRFRDAYPEVSLDVDLTARVVDVVGEGFDVAFRPSSAQADTDELTVRMLGRFRAGLCASPAYLERHAAPTTVEELAEHPLVGLRGMVGRPLPIESADGTRHEFVPTFVAVGSDMSFVVAMVTAGMGIGLLPRSYATRELRRESLVSVLPELQTPLGRLAMVWPRSRFLLPRVRVFVDFVVTDFEAFGPQRDLSDGS